MKRTISKLAILISIGVPTILSSNIAYSGGDVYRPNIWSGFYTGAHIGYTSLDAEISNPGLVNQTGTCGTMDSGDVNDAVTEIQKVTGDTVDGFNFAPNLNNWLNTSGHAGHNCEGIGSFSSSVDGGAVGGVHVGYNFQRGNYVFGIEGDYSKTKAEWSTEASYSIIDQSHPDPDRLLAQGTATTNTEVDAIASLRGRLGWAQDRNMFYLTAGVAWADVDTNRTETYYRRRRPGGVNDDISVFETSSNSETVTGYVVGAGAERMLVEGFTVRGEVLHYEFDDKGFDFNSTTGRVGFSIKIN